MVAAGWIDADGTPAPGLFKAVEQGAATQVWAATSPHLDANGGDYCVDCRITDGSPTDSKAAPIARRQKVGLAVAAAFPDRANGAAGFGIQIRAAARARNASAGNVVSSPPLSTWIATSSAPAW